MLKQKIEHAVAALKAGKLIIVADNEDREAEGDMIGLASQVTPANVNFMTKHARGLLCAPVTPQLAKHLDLHPMTTHGNDAFGTAFTISVDHRSTSTGISAFDRAQTIAKLADDTSHAADFYRPGHVFPLIAKAGGVRERGGHTEAAIDLAKLAGEQAAYICEVLQDDGHMARRPTLKQIAQRWQLDFITIEELREYLASQRQEPEVSVKLPNQYGQFQLSLYLDNEGKEQLVLSLGDLKHAEAPLIRIQSECLTGDVFGSHRCDCGEQLDLAMKEIAAAGTGAVLYLRQEGRGIGLLDKLRAYHLQEQGLDTYDANLALGYPADARHYAIAAWLLKNQGVSKIKLLTNNPDKITQLEQNGIEVVARQPLQTTVYKENKHYLQTKKVKFHQLLSL